MILMSFLKRFCRFKIILFIPKKNFILNKPILAFTWTFGQGRGKLQKKPDRSRAQPDMEVVDSKIILQLL